MGKVGVWIEAFRLRTLPLSLSSIILGSLLAFSHNGFNVKVMIAAILTTLFLQILSNLANDYGDAKSGVDNKNRVGPKRAVQSGVITAKAMKKMIYAFMGLSLLSGIWLIIEGTRGTPIWVSLSYFALGLAAILAALKYTIGKNPYGYRGLGDLFVFIFFGLAGVLGTYYLHTQSFRFDIILPATAIGLLSSGVLNINNLRDIENDAQSGKRTLVVIMGLKAGKIYHLFLIIGAIISGGLYTLMNFNSPWQFAFLLSLPLFIINLNNVFKLEAEALNPELKKLSLSTLFFALLLGVGLVI